MGVMDEIIITVYGWICGDTLSLWLRRNWVRIVSLMGCMGLIMVVRLMGRARAGGTWIKYAGFLSIDSVSAKFKHLQ